jgi:hypothetical protein
MQDALSSGMSSGADVSGHAALPPQQQSQVSREDYSPWGMP